MKAVKGEDPNNGKVRIPRTCADRNMRLGSLILSNNGRPSRTGTLKGQSNFRENYLETRGSAVSTPPRINNRKKLVARCITLSDETI